MTAAADRSGGAAAPQRRASGRVVVDGTRLETLWLPPSADGSATIVMLHEGLGSVGLWRDFPQRLAARTGCGVLAYSRCGHGRSDPLRAPRDVRYMHHEGEVVLPALLAALAIDRPIVFGHSDGASIALIHAGSHPGAPRALILEAPHVFVEELSLRSIADARTAFERGDLRRKLARHHDDVDGMFHGWNDVWLDPRFRSWNIASYLDAIRCPVLAVQGEDDEYGTAAQLATIAARLPSTQTVVLPGCGHAPHRERPDETLAAVAAFIARLGAAPVADG